MGRSLWNDDTLDRLAREFVARYRRGERPLAAEYADRYPQWAEVIHDLFPALARVEQLKPNTEELTAHDAETASAEESKPGRLGDYRLVRVLGQGGMGVVYEAEQESLGRRVALKVLPSQVFADSRALVRFRHEARAAAKLHHTNIVPVFGVGEDRGQHYFVMQFIPGRGLDQVITELKSLKQLKYPSLSDSANPGPMSVDSREDRPSAGMLVQALMDPGQAASPTLGTDLGVNDPAAGSLVASAAASDRSVLRPAASSSLLESNEYWNAVAHVGIQVADALAHAHSQGIFHRDIKPSNLILDARRTVWITDFGLAKSTDSDDLTHTGDVIGTVRYMAPERFRGQGDERSDVYSLGLTLYELLALRPAFDSLSRENLIDQVKNKYPPSPRHWNRKVPADLETIVLKAMAKEPRDRYRTADDLAADLHRFVRNEPIRARRSGIWKRGVKWVRRHPTTALLLAMIGLVATLGFAGVTWQWTRADAARRLAGDRASALERSLYFNLVALAEREWGALNFSRVEQALDACPIHRRGWEWGCLKRLCQRPPLTLRTSVGRASSLAFTPDGSRIATVEAGFDKIGAVKIWDVETGRLLATTPGGFASTLLAGVIPPAIAISPDGRRFAVASAERTVAVNDLATGREELSLTSRGAMSSCLAFSPDGRLVVVAGFDLVLWEAATGREHRRLPGVKEFVTSVAFSPDNRHLATASVDGTLMIWDLEDGTPTVHLRGFQDTILRVAVDSAGRRLVAAGEDGNVYIWNATTGAMLQTLRGHARSVQGVAFSPDGRLVASTGHDQTVRIWDPGEGQERLAIHGHDNVAIGVAFSPDGTRLASSSLDGTVKIWDSRSPPSETVSDSSRILSGHTTVIRGVAFSPDSKRLASVGADKTLKIWDVSSGRTRLDLSGRTGWLFRVAFAPDGRCVATVGETVDGQLKDGVKGEVIIWDATTGRELLSLPGRMCVAYSRDARRVAAMAAGATVKIWDAATGREELALQGLTGVVNSVAFSPDGARLASGGGNMQSPGELILWDTTTGRPVHHLRGHAYPVHCVSFSADGSRLISCGGAFNNPGEIKIWDAKSGQELLALPGHAGAAYAAAFSPDGRWVASAGRDKTVRIWDAATGQELLTLHDHTASVHCAAFSPDGAQLATGSFDRTVRIWETAGWPRSRLTD